MTKVFDSERGRVDALSHASLTVSKGEFVSLLGPSGCGKTTLLRMVGDLEEPTDGRIEVEGLSPSLARQKRQIGTVFQKPALLEWRDVLGNVGLPGELFRDPQVSARAPEMIEKVGLGGFEHAYPRELSGGMQSRVSIARALTHRPSVLLMDEPFGALDEITRERLQIELLRVWRETRAAVLFVTHSIPEALLLSDRVVVMSPRPGRIVEDLAVPFDRPRDGGLRAIADFVALEARLRERLNSYDFEIGSSTNV
ncbi:MAG: ABC transporter ATP-binding protein [Candidatus Latescibacterota bacterium]|nr:ABC transporter ATP-binding protein [Candidatus Latescibacterota bacterium]